MNSIDWLRCTLTEGAKISLSKADEIELDTHAQFPSGALGRHYKLKIIESDRGVQVSEIDTYRVLPTCCLERHINYGGTFCTFIGSTEAISNKKTACDWWKGLNQYLSDQEYATKYKKWPIHRNMSHGAAAKVQIVMEEIASKKKWEKEVLYGMFRGEGWLGELFQRLDDNKITFDQGSSCPRGCLYKHNPNIKIDCEKKGCKSNCRKKHSSVLLADCPNQEVVVQLISLEEKRRKLEKDFMTLLMQRKVECCGTMRDCPLSN